MFYVFNVCDIWVLVLPNIEKVIPAAVVVFMCIKVDLVVVEFSHVIIYHKKLFSLKFPAFLNLEELKSVLCVASSK